MWKEDPASVGEASSLDQSGESIKELRLAVQGQEGHKQGHDPEEGTQGTFGAIYHDYLTKCSDSMGSALLSIFQASPSPSQSCNETFEATLGHLLTLSWALSH